MHPHFLFEICKAQGAKRKTKIFQRLLKKFLGTCKIGKVALSFSGIFEDENSYRFFCFLFLQLKAQYFTPNIKDKSFIFL